MADDKKDEENIGSFYMGRTRQAPAPKRFLPPGLLTVIALAALGGIIWYAYPRGAEKYTDVDVPVIKADTAPIKAAPVDPGGMDVPHQDSTAFDPLTKNGGAEVEKLLPAPEQPLDKDQVIKAAQAIPPVLPSSLPPKLGAQVKLASNGAEEIVPPKAPEARPLVTVASLPPKAAVKPAPQTEEDDAADDSDEDDADTIKAAPKAAATAKPAPKPAVAAKPAAAAVAAPPPASGAGYEVQLGSYRAPADAKKDWDRFKIKFAPQLGALKMRLVKVDIPSKGTYYRLQAGAVSKDRAHEICDALKSHPGGCILAKQ